MQKDYTARDSVSVASGVFWEQPFLSVAERVSPREVPYSSRKALGGGDCWCCFFCWLAERTKNRTGCCGSCAGDWGVVWVGWQKKITVQEHSVVVSGTELCLRRGAKAREVTLLDSALD